MWAQVAIVDPEAAGFVTGGGTIQSPAGACADDQTAAGVASFEFVSKYHKGKPVPDGNIKFRFDAAGLEFESTSYEWLVTTGSDCAKYKGLGQIKGDDGDYGFMLTACDNDKHEDKKAKDTFRIKIWQVANDKDNRILYDNLLDEKDDISYDGTHIDGGKIQVHRPSDKKTGAGLFN